MPVVQEKPEIKPAFLPEARAPEIIATFEEAPDPEALMKLGARVEETPLHVGKWRGTGAKTLRYVLELGEDQAVRYRNRILAGLTLKITPSGRKTVEDAAPHQGARYAAEHAASRVLWKLDPEVTREMDGVADRLYSSSRRDDPIQRLYFFNTLLASALYLEHRALVLPAIQRLAPRTPIRYTDLVMPELKPYLDPGRTWKGTLERIRAGRAEKPDPLPEAYALFEGGTLRFSAYQNRAELPAPAFLKPPREQILEEGVYEGLEPNRDHPEAGHATHPIDRDRLLDAVAEAREAFQATDPKTLARELKELLDDLPRAWKAPVQFALKLAEKEGPTDEVRRELWKVAVRSAAALLTEAEGARNFLTLFPEGRRPLARLAIQAETAVDTFLGLAIALGMRATTLAELCRVIYDRPTGPRQGYHDPAPT